jgi:cytochrome P450
MTHAASAYPPKSIWSARRTPQDPIAFLQGLAAQGDIVPFSLGGRPAFLVNHPEHVEDVLVVHHSKFSKPLAFQRSGVLLGSGLLTAEGELHRRRRRVLQPAFSADRMDAYGATVVRCAEHIHEHWRDGQLVDMAAEMHRLTLAVIGQILFGADLAAEAADIRRALTVASASLDPLLSLLAPTRRLRLVSDYLRTLVDRLINQRLASSDDGDHVVGVLRRAEGSSDEPVTDQLRDDLLTLFVAGHDTIANALTWTWQLLAQHPEVETRLQGEIRRILGGQPPTFKHVKDLPYTSWVLAESLRLYPPSWVLTRRALDDCDIGGTFVPAGAIIVVSQYLLHRDRRFFPDALAFDPGRWDPAGPQARPRLAFFPFGAGPRSCIGQGLATMEGILLLAALARRWRFEALTPIDSDPRATLRSKGPVRMQVKELR